MFACPVCKKPFDSSKNNKKLRCGNNKCNYFNKDYLQVNDIPILIPFGEKYCVFKNESNSKFFNVGSKKREDFSRIKKFKLKLKKFLYGENKNTKNNFRKLLKYINKDSKILIIGGGTIGGGISDFHNWCKNNNLEINSLDVYFSENINVIADAHYLPFPENYFDIVIIQAVIEHLVNPKRVLDEAFHSMKINGVIYAETPFLQPVAEGPYDFHRYTHSGHRLLFSKYEELSSGYVTGAFSSSLFVFSYAMAGLFKKQIIGVFTRIIFTRIFKFFDTLIADDFNIDVACGCFFMGIKKNYSEFEDNQENIIDYYKGAQK